MRDWGTKFCLFIALNLFFVSGCFHADDKNLGIEEVSDIPILWENGIPYFTRFQTTDHYQLNLAGIWKFKIDPEGIGEKEKWYEPEFDDKDWFAHPVPGSWNVQREEWLNYVGVGWYRTRFIAPENFSGRFNRLILDGVSFRVDVYLNGKFLGSHSGGFSRFNFDVSDSLKYGEENVLALKVDNRRRWDELPPMVHKNGALGWLPYGGIHHQALIESGPEATVCKLSVYTEHTGRLNLQAGVYNHSEENRRAMVVIQLRDLDGNFITTLGSKEVFLMGKSVSVIKLDRTIEGIKPWSLEEPQNRYGLVVRVDSLGQGYEEQSLEIGFRKFEFKGNRLYFNGKPIFLLGVNRHEDDPKTGRFQSDERISEDLSLLKQLNANFIRTSHYPNDPRFLDACDREGFLVMEEISLHQVGWGFAGVISAEKDALFQNAGRELLETIERDRNHPSLVMYSLGDDSFTFLPSIRILHKRLYTLARRFDHERAITMAVVTVPYRVTPWLEMTAGIGDVISVNEYYGWYYGELNQLSSFLDSLHKKWSDKPIIISELGAEGVPGLKPGGKLYPIGYGKKRDFSEEYQVKFLRSQLETIKSKSYISGVIVWVFADHRDDKRPLSAVPQMNTKGLLTYERKKKQAFDVVAEFFNAMQTLKPITNSQ